MDSKSPIISVIGIVGGVGAGKTVVADEFVRLGCVKIDADLIGHELLSCEEVQAELRQRWGDDVFAGAGEVDRRKLGNIVFCDECELQELNRIMHPRIRKRIEERIGQIVAAGTCKAVVLDAAVLFEAGWNDLCTSVVFVESDGELRSNRVLSERGWAKKVWADREKSQFSLDRKRLVCDYVIDNRSSISCLQTQVHEVFQKIGCS